MAIKTTTYCFNATCDFGPRFADAMPGQSMIGGGA